MQDYTYVCELVTLQRPAQPSIIRRQSISLYSHLTCCYCIIGGKRDEELILPINSSLSVTLHQDQVLIKLCSYTSEYVCVLSMDGHDLTLPFIIFSSKPPQQWPAAGHLRRIASG